MGRISQYSDYVQKAIIKLHLKGIDWRKQWKIQNFDSPAPSDRTVQRGC